METPDSGMTGIKKTATLEQASRLLAKGFVLVRVIERTVGQQRESSHIPSKRSKGPRLKALKIPARRAKRGASLRMFFHFSTVFFLKLNSGGIAKPEVAPVAALLRYRHLVTIPITITMKPIGTNNCDNTKIGPNDDICSSDR